jgi:hypothetical protein
VAVSIVGGVPWVAAVTGMGSGAVYTPGAEAGAWQATTTLPGLSQASIVALQSAVDGNGGYHLVAVANVGSAVSLMHLKPGQFDWAVTPIGGSYSAGAATLSGDGVVEVVWSDLQGAIWTFYENGTGAASKLSSDAHASGTGAAVVSKSAADGPSVLYSTTTTWSLLHGGSTTTVLQGAPGPGVPSLVLAASGALFGAVYQPMGNAFVQTSLVTSSGGAWSVVTTAPNARAATVTTRSTGSASMAIRRDYQSPMDSDVALVECP